jgi:hypothetical protein
VWRMLADDPKFNTANYHKMAERHWGLIRADGTPKTAFQPFVDGVVRESRLSTSNERTRRSEQAN